MGQSLHVETQSQDPQEHNNGGETPDSCSNLCVLNSFALLCSHLEGSQFMKNLTSREISDCIISVAEFLLSLTSPSFSPPQECCSSVIVQMNLGCSVTYRGLFICSCSYSNPTADI